jgi:hypothetical protein
MDKRARPETAVALIQQRVKQGPEINVSNAACGRERAALDRF